MKTTRNKTERNCVRVPHQVYWNQETLHRLKAFATKNEWKVSDVIRQTVLEMLDAADNGEVLKYKKLKRKVA